jgi:dTDP-4-amino-4,6-dideoxygalactose transaminase
VSAANAFALRGAELSFVDVDQDGNIDPNWVAAALTPRTRAVVAVHYAGNSCDLSQLLAACGKVPLIEDAAQAIGASFADRPLGTWGTLGTFSFHETKNIGSGEGGALTLRDPAMYRERAHMIRDKGTNRQSFISGQVSKYTWTSLGSSYGLSDLNAAYLLGQLEAFEIIQARRHVLHTAYLEALSAPLERAGGYLVRARPGNMPNHHLFAMVLRNGEQRDAFIAHMKSHDIVTPFHYVALHLSPMGHRFHRDQRSLTTSERLSTCLVRLPLFFNLTDPDQAEVIERTLEFLNAS